MRPTIALALLPLILTGCSATGEPRAVSPPQASSSIGERLLAGKVAGDPVRCIRAIDANRAITLAGSGVAYRVNSDLVYVQQFGGQCVRGRNADNSYLVRRSTQSQLCAGDIAEVIDRTSRTPIGSCVYGDFVPYRTRGR